MIEFERTQFRDANGPFPEIHGLYNAIKSIHVVADHTKDVLRKNQHIKDFCEEARHFLKLPHGILASYDVWTWWHSEEFAPVKIVRIQLYDNDLEFELAKTNIRHN